MGLLESLDVYPKKARVSGSKRRVNKTINAGRRRTLLLYCHLSQVLKAGPLEAILVIFGRRALIFVV